MNHLLKMAMCVLLVSGCTTTPDKYKRDYSGPAPEALVPPGAQSGKMQTLASADIGVPNMFIDGESGITVELTVISEYFSANGRQCRRFIEVTNGQEKGGVGCLDTGQGWIELPLAADLR